MSKIIITVADVADQVKFISHMRRALGLSLAHIRSSIDSGVPLHEWTLFMNDHDDAERVLEDVLTSQANGEATLRIFELGPMEDFSQHVKGQKEISAEVLRNILESHRDTQRQFESEDLLTKAEFLVEDSWPAGAPGEVIVTGRCAEVMIRSGCTFHQITVKRWLGSIYDPEPPVYVVDRQHDANMTVRAITAYDRELDELSPGVTAALRIAGAGVDALQTEVAEMKEQGRQGIARSHLIVLSAAGEERVGSEPGPVTL